jgi:hypothetical protein
MLLPFACWLLPAVRTGQSEKTVRTVHPAQETEDNTVGTGQQEQDG